jgi:hypothetical protein
MTEVASPPVLDFRFEISDFRQEEQEQKRPGGPDP